MRLGLGGMRGSHSCCFMLLPPHSFLYSPFSHQSKTSSLPIVSGSSKRRQAVLRCRIENAAINTASASKEEDDNGGGGGFLVVSFYKFVYIEDPEALVSDHFSFLQGRDIHGRIYVNEQGINAQYSGPRKDALAYVQWLKDDSRFSDILVQASPAFSRHAFPRLKLRYKPSLVQDILLAGDLHRYPARQQLGLMRSIYDRVSLLPVFFIDILFEGGTLHLPLLDPTMRATPLTPSEWRERLEAVDVSDVQSCKEANSVPKKKFMLLDVRNGYEWDIGHFQGAHRPNVDCFRGTSFGLSAEEVVASDPLVGIDKENTDILMYCTGGIRCDIYSTILKQRGFQNLYTLSGGVTHYLDNEGPSKWVGNLFVFDSRLSLPPSTYKSGEIAGERRETEYENGSFAKCYICSSQLVEFRHRNCANLDCNKLFLCCALCVKELRGCCCSDCTSAPRLRPVLPRNQRYEKWHLYRDA